MPELPEVETVRRILEREVVGKTIAKVEVYRPKNVVTGAEAFAAALPGKRIERMGRVGKFLLFGLSEGLLVFSHLRMEGKYYAGQDVDPLDKHEILRFLFEDGTRLSYIDTRKFGVLGLESYEGALSRPPLSEVGPEPWDIDEAELARRYRRKKGPIKEALLDQSIMSGLGNIYADEVLFAAKLHPLKSSFSLTLEEAATIKKEAARILNTAIDNGGSTIRSYHPKEGMDGRMQNALKAYGRVDEPCLSCGMRMKKIRVGGRGTTYCPNCQKEAEHPFVVALSGRIASGKSAAGALLERRGFFRIDLDEVVKRLYEKKEVLEHLSSLLGPSAVKDGKLDRAYVLSLLSADPELKGKLEAYVHPLAYEEAIKMEKGHAKVLYEVPFYLSSPIEERTDALIYVKADPQIRAERIKKRNKNPEEALKLNENYPWDEVEKKADVLLDGNYSLDQLARQLAKIPYLN